MTFEANTTNTTNPANTVNEASNASKGREIISLYRDCMAMLVPHGTYIKLSQGTEVTVLQALGDSFTVSVYGNMARIAGKDADALGKPVRDLLQEMPLDASVEEMVWAQLRTVFDPEIPVNIVDLGLIYRCEINALPVETYENEIKETLTVPEVPTESKIAKVSSHQVAIDMTLTAPGCGMGPVIAEDVKQKIMAIPSVEKVEVAIVFDPPWDRSMMSQVAQLELGMFY